MRLRWGDNEPQQVQYGDGKSETSQVSTFSKDDMCSYIHTAVMSGIDPSSISYYRYGSDSVGWSDKIQFKTPAAGGSDELKFLAFVDMEKAPLDASVEHFLQPGSLSVTKAMADEVDNGNVDSIFHIGDISYATGFLVEWDFFLHLKTPVASRLSYMTAIGIMRVMSIPVHSFDGHISCNYGGFGFYYPHSNCKGDDHLWLAHFSKNTLYHNKDGQYDCGEGVTARFEIGDYKSGKKNNNNGVKRCGIRPVYKQDVEYLNELSATDGAITMPSTIQGSRFRKCINCIKNEINADYSEADDTGAAVGNTGAAADDI
ncbi:hypothetical protein LWI29_014012 [Acer saccharum]|uniref:Uncharacterized protein n=1 Tax=Acer saccharum TaxID=4024 RepID=A0AA39VIE7_ACESA|nr:hypothetical protein LWI29_014012 [Acer saccharum]